MGAALLAVRAGRGVGAPEPEPVGEWASGRAEGKEGQEGAGGTQEGPAVVGCRADWCVCAVRCLCCVHGANRAFVVVIALQLGLHAGTWNSDPDINVSLFRITTHGFTPLPAGAEPVPQPRRGPGGGPGL